MRRFRAYTVLPLLLLMAACSSQPAPPSSAGPSAPPITASPSPAGSPGASPAEPSATPGPDSTPSASPGAPQLPQDTVARVVTNDLRVRSKPEVSAGSKKLEPLLDQPRLVLVVDGPVEASGYTWYQVAPIQGVDELVELPFGWVAAADKDGTPWIAPASDACPSVPRNATTLYRLSGLLALACFGDRDIVVNARLAQPEATCGIELGWTIEPGWLGSTCAQPPFLVEDLSGEPLDAFAIIDPALDISAFEPGVESADWLSVRLTGRYDHPAATTCRLVETDVSVARDPAQIVLGCRATFVITAIRPA